MNSKSPVRNQKAITQSSKVLSDEAIKCSRAWLVLVNLKQCKPVTVQMYPIAL